MHRHIGLPRRIPSNLSDTYGCFGHKWLASAKLGGVQSCVKSDVTVLAAMAADGGSILKKKMASNLGGHFPFIVLISMKPR